MIVYPTWETTPSPQSKVEEKPKKKKKKKVISAKPKQLPVFIDDYANQHIKISELQNLNLDKVLAKLSKTISQIDVSKIYEPKGEIPFPKEQSILDGKFDLNKYVAKYKVLETFDNSVFLKAYTSADNLSNTVGIAKVKVQVTKDQLPPALLEFPNGIALSNQEIGEMFGIPTKDLLGITIELASDTSDPFSNIDPIYTVTFERLIDKDGYEPF